MINKKLEEKIMNTDYTNIKRINSREIELIIEKAVEGQEISEEEIDTLLQYMYKSVQHTQKYLDDFFPISRKMIVLLKVTNLISKIKYGKKTEGVSEVVPIICNIKKTLDTSNQEISRGIKITANNQSLENIKILIQQDQMLKEYMDSLGVLFEETEDRFNDYHQDYETPIASEHKEVLTKTKTKMKTLGKQYQVNKK